MTAILAEFLQGSWNFSRLFSIISYIVLEVMLVSFADCIVVSPDVMIRTVGEESVLLNLKTELYIGLDAVGSRMWAALTQSPSVEAAYEAILAEFDVEAGELRRDLEEFIGKLLQYQLVEVKAREISATG